jgi:hypothetical protein
VATTMPRHQEMTPQRLDHDDGDEQNIFWSKLASFLTSKLSLLGKKKKKKKKEKEKKLRSAADAGFFTLLLVTTSTIIIKLCV